MSRKELLSILQERVAELGVTVHYRALAPDVEELRAPPPPLRAPPPGRRPP
ncbi:Hypothetical protein KLENKIAIHU_3425 [Klenkia terrae]|uniref:hypothetical protein n=1 Tax=Klenkia terrae TaxID=1052259 RepID=UPI00176C1641|nr:hypothetical protein [Klenkia terrae]SSC24806.1 Hypothetical protein KLENKIAIHU_3425 [Klenkia terrae]